MINSGITSQSCPSFFVIDCCRFESKSDLLNLWLNGWNVNHLINFNLLFFSLISLYNWNKNP
ncbi:hypothetical protein DERP_004296 [Dermatophagoides pteronyssinus]|uniref:Uncharacterized protein n=1 Tax=Dermatophagoides pteronyssinus TaxID=6956 RepID=A0ABQ8JNC6_DERPT|nr:hypothetical protein DERP_004296 [Dermatophagoides pteronyssinus]